MPQARNCPRFGCSAALEGEVVEWRPAELRLSDLPSGRSVGSYEAAYGFNQHVALLMLDQLGSPGLRFGRIDAEPTEPTVSAADVFEGRQSAGKGPRWIQSATLLALFIVLVAFVCVAPQRHGDHARFAGRLRSGAHHASAWLGG